MQKQFQIVLLALVILAGWGCTTDFEVYAPEKEIRSVYCVLNSRDSVQYVRIAKAFQYEGDAISYAGANDFSVTGLTVKLKTGNKVWTATEMPNFPKDPGGFLPTHTVYQFTTDGSGVGRDTLALDKEYTLEIGTPDAADFVTGKTYLAELPRIKGDLQIVAGAGNSQCLPKLFLDRKFNFSWKKNSRAGVRYEIRVGLRIATNGTEQVLQWGPSKLLDDNQRCNEGAGSICYQFQEKELLRDFFRSMPVIQFTKYTYVTRDSCVPQPNLVGNLPKSMWFEVTTVDEYLSNYMTVNDPAVTDLNGAKPEYTNLTGNIEAIGVFGSYVTDRRYAIMRECSEALLGLNGRVLPPGCVWE
jgi:hypothetical protein